MSSILPVDWYPTIVYESARVIGQERWLLVEVRISVNAQPVTRGVIARVEERHENVQPLYDLMAGVRVQKKYKFVEMISKKENFNL